MIKKRRNNSVLTLLSLILCISSVSAQQNTVGLMKKVNGNDENGYILFSPLGVDTVYLIDKCGQKVHSWTTQYAPGMALYLKPNGNLLKAGTYFDTTFGVAGGRGGIVEEYNWNGDLIWHHIIFNDSLCQHHDIRPMPNGNVLVLAWHAIPKADAILKGRLSQNFGNTDELWGERIIEIKQHGVDSAEIVWQWDVFDHIVQDVSSTTPNYGNPDDHPELIDINYALNLKTEDWIHANGIDYNADLDQIVISAHNFSELWIIDHSTTTSQASKHSGGNSGMGGDILYRWGNPAAYKKGNKTDQKLFRQHNVHWIPNGYRDSGKLIIFNNGWGRDTFYSTIDIINTPRMGSNYINNLPYLPLGPSWEYKDSTPINFFSQIISGANVLPNGNVLICSGVQGRFFEVTPTKQIVWEYRNPVGQADIQEDGVAARNNSVFRAEFYPSNYPAFTGKNLGQKGPLEANPAPYTCSPEFVKPYHVKFTPLNNTIEVLPNANIQVEFSENILKNTGNVTLYANGIQFQSININNPAISISGKTLTINPSSDFPVNARIAVRIPASALRDSSFNTLAQAIDTANWHFYTIKSKPTLLSTLPLHQTLNVNAKPIIKLFYNENITKNTSGNISIYENGSTLFETIPVNSSNVVINGTVVTITPSKAFNPDKLMVIESDACFKNQYNILTPPIQNGDWYFRTAPAPKVLALSPGNTTVNNVLRPVIKITLNKNFVLDSIKDLRIYENNVLKYTFSLSDPNITIDANSVSVGISNDFAYKARVAVQIPSYALKDTFGFYFEGIDTADWHFSTQSKVSVNQIMSAEGLSLYPNPVSDVLNIELKEAIEQVEILDLNGKSISMNALSKETFKWTMDTSNLNSGVYIIKINGHLAAKIAVQ